MTYLNGKNVLPKELFQQVQRYCSGQLLYIPAPSGHRKSWGEETGIRRELAARNQIIREKKRRGSTLEELAEEFHLSVSSLKEIIYQH